LNGTKEPSPCPECPALIEVVKHGYRNETKEYVSYETNAGDALLRYGRGVELIK
jgi:hypothetical protein